VHHHAVDLHELAWAAGWLLAVGIVFAWGMRLPLATPGTLPRRRWRSVLAVAGGCAVAALAIAALSLHDAQVDLTRERVYTPAPQALEVARRLGQPVRVTYYYQGTDPNARRALEMLERMAGENPLLEVSGVDPDKQPSLARTAGIKLYNAALIEAAGRRVLVHSTDEREFAIGIQRALRERRVTLCFVEGHHELPVENREFRNEVESVGGHDHDDANSMVIETTERGIGRWRRSLEGLGYDIRRISLAQGGGVPADCAAVVVAGPREPWAPAESGALRRYLVDGGAALLLLDVGFTPDPGLAALLSALGVELLDAVVVDDVSHYGTDAQTVAVTGYDPHPVTERVAYTFFPGVRPLAPVAGTTAQVTPLIRSSGASVLQSASAGADAAPPASQLLAVASEGRLDGSPKAFRALVAGDADFLANPHYPYMANSDLALAMARWLVREEALVATAPHVPATPLVMITEAQLSALYLLLVLLLPGLAVGLGVLVWWRRR
jgi:hypothetical protein